MTPTHTGASLNTIALLGPYAPRRSTLARFTKRLRDHLADEIGGENVIVLAVDDKTGGYAYPEDVHMHVYADAHKGYRAAADMLNINNIDVCLIQHDIDLYGVEDGKLILDLLRRLRMPAVCALHTVRAKPTEGQTKVMEQIIQLCDRLIVTTEKDEEILKNVYGPPASKVALVPPTAPRAVSEKTGEAAWQELAAKYLQIAGDVVRKRRRSPRATAPRNPQALSPHLIPDIDLNHLKALTDATGMIQHATYTIPNRQHGYTTDDNARAVVAALMYHDLRKDPSVIPLARTYLSFIHNAFNPEAQRFRNFMSYERMWLEDVGSEDAHGRVLWALGLAVAFSPDDGVLAFATRLFNEALPPVEKFSSPRAWAFATIGIHAYLRRFSGDVNTRRLRETLTKKLLERFTANRGKDWPWCEDSLTYGNAKLPHALILSGQWLPDEKMLAQGLESLQWLLDIQTTDDGTLRLIGNDGWLDRSGHHARFDQQPIEAMGLIEALREAHRATGQRKWAQAAYRCLGWFLGQNDTGAMLYDPTTGGCRDGLQSDGPNNNEGAESTLAWLISLISIHDLLASGFAPSTD